MPIPRLAQSRFAPAFTLIELLIVVAIIAILAAIAVPNFLEAQTRAKVSRVKSDMRTIITALETYRIDRNHYPPRHNPVDDMAVPRRDTRLEDMSAITTPVSYLTSLPADVFEKTIPAPNNIIEYWDAEQVAWWFNAVFDQPGTNPEFDEGSYNEYTAGWLLMSVGPDGFMGINCSDLTTNDSGEFQNEDYWPNPDQWAGSGYCPYDPTNGTVSGGNIYATQQGGIGGSGSYLTNLFW